jgi:hypothetical protein
MISSFTIGFYFIQISLLYFSQNFNIDLKK